MTRFPTRGISFLAVLVFTAALLLVGCDKTSPPEAEESAGELTGTFVANRPDSLDSVPFEEFSKRKKKELLRQRRKAYEATEEAIRTASGWQQADQHTRALLEESSAAPQYYREQVAAHWMLERWLLEGQPTPEKQKATGFYTELMLENGNPQGQLIQPALEQLKGVWAEGRVAKAAAATARRTKEYMEGPNYQSALRQLKRQEDQLETKAKEQAFRASADSFRTSMTNAVNQLEAMTGFSLD
jgi:hypothetical protein